MFLTIAGAAGAWENEQSGEPAVLTEAGYHAALVEINLPNSVRWVLRCGFSEN